jgi:hypothetical protein
VGAAPIMRGREIITYQREINTIFFISTNIVKVKLDHDLDRTQKSNIIKFCKNEAGP